MDENILKELLPFLKLPDFAGMVAKVLPEHLKWATRKYIQNEIARMKALTSLPVGDTVINYLTGEFMEWTDDLLETTNLRISAFQAQLDKMETQV